jgi:5-methyltetrahydropteroyltriglutamate--homocysteine methyltransferase
VQPVHSHAERPDVSFDGGDLDCGNGLLLLIRKHIDPMQPGQLLEIRSTEISVDEDLPAWCRLTGNELVSWTKQGRQRSFLVSKGLCAGSRQAATVASATVEVASLTPVATAQATALPSPAPAPRIEPLSVMGIGSWPRPLWMKRALHDRLEGRLADDDFDRIADDAVRMCVDAQVRAGAHVITDGEQRRDSYANFVGARLDNCQLIPLTDLLALTEDPAELEREFAALDVPASEVRHPVVYGPLGRSRPIAAHELAFARTLTDRPVKVALPGPYTLSRILWLDCITTKPYPTRAAITEDIVRVLREELHFLLAGGAALVQFDEPVLTEVVFGAPKGGRSFMCGALAAKEDEGTELAFARDAINAVVAGLPRERVGLHVCRGNWSPDESVALAGDYRPLIDLLRSLEVGTYFLELATPRAGDIDVLRALPHDRRVGVGVVNQKLDHVEAGRDIEARVRRAVDVLGKDRVLLHPDCGFATFADNPVTSAEIAGEKLRAIVEAAAAATLGMARGAR